MNKFSNRGRYQIANIISWQNSLYSSQLSTSSVIFNNFNKWMLKKLKTTSCVRLIHSLLFIFSLMIDSLIKQQTAWSQGSSKYKKQKKWRVLLIDNLLITSLIPILSLEYFKEKSWLTSLTSSKVGLLILQLSITEVSSAFDHSNMWSSENIPTIKWVLMMWLTSCQLITHALIYCIKN
jgi:hypothetical protein